MTQEIVDAIKMLEREKGIDSETLMAALEDGVDPPPVMVSSVAQALSNSRDKDRTTAP